MSPGTETPERRRPVAALLLLILVAQTALHLAWFARDRRIPFWDQYRYYAMTRSAADILEGRSASGIAGLLDLHPSHPPLYPLAGVAPLLLSDGGFPGARLVNLLTAALTTMLAFALARRLLGGAPALVAAAVAAFSPLVTTIAHLYYIENLLVPIVIASVLAIVSGPFRSPGRAALFGLLAGAGCLVKWTWPVFLAAPALAAAARERKWREAAIAAAAAALVAGPWYATHAAGIAAFFEAGVTGGAGHLSGISGAAGLLYYPKTLVLSGLGIPATVAAVAGFAVLVRRDRKRAWLLLLLVAVPVVVFTFVLTKKPRHLLPVVPLLGIPVAAAVAALRPRGVSVLAGALVVLHLALASLQASFGLLPGGAPALGPLPLLTRTHNDDPGPPDATAWPYAAILDALPAPPSPGRPGRVLLAFNLLAFRDTGFEYHAREQGRPFTFGLLPLHFPPGHPGHHPYPLTAEAVEGTFGLLDADLVIAKGGAMWMKVQSGEPVHRDAARLGEALLDPQGPLASAFAPVARVPLPDGSTAAVFRRLPDGDAAIAAFARRWDAAHDRPPLEEHSREPDREDLQEAAARLLPADHPRREPLRRLLALRETARVSRDPPAPELALARMHRDAGNDRAAILWLRRALEADAALGREVLRLAASWNIPIADSSNPLESLR